MFDLILAIPATARRPYEPKTQPRDASELFKAHFDQLLNPGHELIVLAIKIDWSGLETGLVDTYDLEFAAPAKAIRLMVGLHYLKYAFDESKESLVDRWVDNPYWQYFCGYTPSSTNARSTRQA